MKTLLSGCIISLLCLSAACGYATPQPTAPEFGRAELTITTVKSTYKFDVEIAATDEQLVQGLMYRHSLGLNEGMLFIFPRQRQVAMWMKDTYIPLDMLFIDKHNRIRDIRENAEPLSTDIIYPKVPVVWVLEVPAGTVKRLGISLQDKVRYQVIP